MTSASKPKFFDETRFKKSTLTTDQAELTQTFESKINSENLTRYEKFDRNSGSHNMEFYDFLNTDIKFQPKPRQPRINPDDAVLSYQKLIPHKASHTEGLFLFIFL